MHILRSPTIKRGILTLSCLVALSASATGYQQIPHIYSSLTIRSADQTRSVTDGQTPASVAPREHELTVPPIVTIVQGSANGRDVVDVLVNGAPIVSLFSKPPGSIVAAQTISLRLMTVSQHGLTPTQVAAAELPGGTWAVTIDNRILATATAAEAEAQNSSSEQIARSWTAALQHQLSSPVLTSPFSSLLIPDGELRTFTPGGTVSADQIATFSADPSIAAITYDSSHRTVCVSGISPGRTAVYLRDGENGPFLTLPVEVKYYAAQIEPQCRVSVTGYPETPLPVLQQAIAAGMAQSVHVQNGARLQFLVPPDIPATLEAGTGREITLSLKATGPDMIEVCRTVTVHLQSISQRMKPAALLYFSNDPEEVSLPGSLFSAGLPSGESVRLDYHHQNVGATPFVFRAAITNRSSLPATVQLIAGASLPGTDTIQVGRRAGAAFLHAMAHDAGLVVIVPAGTSMPIVEQRFVPGTTVSGVVQILVTEGASAGVSVDVNCLPDPGAPLAVSELASTIVPAGALITGESVQVADDPSSTNSGEKIYPGPQIVQKLTYTVGQAWRFIQLGTDSPIANISGNGKLLGNYGVDYDCTIDVVNPEPIAATILLSFAPTAGEAAGVFQMDDGSVIELDPIKPPNEVLLEQYLVPPNGTRTIHFHTMPLNGSYYPATLIIHAK